MMQLRTTADTGLFQPCNTAEREKYCALKLSHKNLLVPKLGEYSFSCSKHAGSILTQGFLLFTETRMQASSVWLGSSG